MRVLLVLWYFFVYVVVDYLAYFSVCRWFGSFRVCLFYCALVGLLVDLGNWLICYFVVLWCFGYFGSFPATWLFWLYVLRCFCVLCVGWFCRLFVLCLDCFAPGLICCCTRCAVWVDINRILWV